MLTSYYTELHCEKEYNYNGETTMVQIFTASVAGLVDGRGEVHYSGQIEVGGREVNRRFKFKNYKVAMEKAIAYIKRKELTISKTTTEKYVSYDNGYTWNK